MLTTLVVKEDSMTLYGFRDTADREMFHTLQGVSGLGPKLALAALSVMGASELAQAISSGDSKTLQSIPGVCRPLLPAQSSKKSPKHCLAWALPKRPHVLSLQPWLQKTQMQRTPRCCAQPWPSWVKRSREGQTRN